MTTCCQPQPTQDHCSTQQKKFDYLFWGSLGIIAVGYAISWIPNTTLSSPALIIFTDSVHELMHRMWWGVLLGILFVGIITTVPGDAIMKVLGKGGTLKGILRATLAGVLLDLCSHGILMVGAQLYKKGVSLGQLMAFLVASPWNSLSLTLILWSLVGLKWMLAILFLSLIIAIITGLIFDRLEKAGILPSNPHTNDVSNPLPFSAYLKSAFRMEHFTPKSIWTIISKGMKESTMVLRWIFFGVLIASLIRTVVDAHTFTSFFGPTIIGLFFTLIAATIIEVCSEGSVPIAADLLTRAGAPGNAFAFLMTGVSTDYTEMLVLKDTTKSWKIALFLPLVTVPQVIIVALMLNQLA